MEGKERAKVWVWVAPFVAAAFAFAVYSVADCQRANYQAQVDGMVHMTIYYNGPILPDTLVMVRP